VHLVGFILRTAIELSLDGSSPYTSTDKTNKNKYTQTKQYKKHSTNNTKHSKVDSANGRSENSFNKTNSLLCQKHNNIIQSGTKYTPYFQ